jgi:D-3-phosphoglycerate dehydrogenase
MFTLPNIVLTPHLGASTEEAQINVAIIMAEQLLDALKGKTIRNAVNIPAIPIELLKEMTPYLELSEKLGSFLAQIMDGQIKRITLKYAGEVCSTPTDLITVAAVKGILTSMLSEALNFVNARIMAKERGIEVVETISRWKTMITVMKLWEP